jgi:hypothetical protein
MQLQKVFYSRTEGAYTNTAEAHGLGSRCKHRKGGWVWMFVRASVCVCVCVLMWIFVRALMC